jgi:hypothetical protein
MRDSDKLRCLLSRDLIELEGLRCGCPLQRKFWLAVPISSKKTFSAANLNIENILEFIVGPYNIFLVSSYLRQRVTELIEAVWEILTFVNENLIVERLDLIRLI